MVKKLLDLISRIIVENIPFFIVLGMLSLFSESHVYLHELKKILQKYIFPAVICYSSGKTADKKYGGIAGTVVLSAVLINYEFQSFLEPIAIGLITGGLTRKYSEIIGKVKLPGYEMTFNNLGIAVLAIGMSLGSFYIMPFYKEVQKVVISELSSVVFNSKFLPLLSLVIEPAKVFFLNNLINHSFLSALGFLELNEKGKSVFFLLETNPGPGLGILLYYYLYERRQKNLERVKEVKSNIFIHFIGGIHEVYFSYVLKNLKLIGALVAGGMSGVYIFQKLGAGLVGVASPGSVLLLLLLAPLEDKIYIFFGVTVSALVTFFVAFLMIKKKEESSELTEINFSEAIMFSDKKLEICVSCDAGMGSSAMGATLLRKKLEKEGIKNIKVINSSIDSIPESSNIIVVHKQLVDRLKGDISKKDVFVINDFMDSAFYEILVKKIKELALAENSEKDENKISEDKRENIKKPEEKSPLNAEPKKRKVLERDNIYLGLKRTDKISALVAAGRILQEKGYVEEGYINSMIDRENLSSTYLEHGIAIPHCTGDGVKYIKNSGITVLQYPYGINYGEGKTVYLIVAIAGIRDSHMNILEKMADIFDDERIAEQLSTTVEIEEIYESLLSLEDDNVK